MSALHDVCNMAMSYAQSEQEQERNARRLQQYRERRDFYDWHLEYSGERFVFPLPISGRY